MITTPPALISALSDPRMKGATRQCYDWCILNLDVQTFRPVKATGLPAQVGRKLQTLVSLGYLEHRARPAHEPQHYRLLWSRKERAA